MALKLETSKIIMLNCDIIEKAREAMMSAIVADPGCRVGEYPFDDLNGWQSKIAGPVAVLTAIAKAHRNVAMQAEADMVAEEPADEDTPDYYRNPQANEEE